MVLLFWPTTLTPIPIISPTKGDKEAIEEKEIDAKNGFVVGWESRFPAHSSSINVNNTQGHENENNKTAGVAVPSNGIICAGIITIDDSGTVDGCIDHLASFQKIQNAIQALKRANMFGMSTSQSCISESGSKAKDHGDNEKSTSLNTKTNECCHANNIIIQELKVVARWTDCPSNIKNTFGTVLGKSEETVPFSHGHQQRQQTTLCHLPLITTKSMSFKSIQLPGVNLTPLQTILFQPCPLQSLDHYHHSFETTYHSLFVNDSNNMGSRVFSSLLMRLSETESVMDRLNYCLNNQTSKANEEKEETIFDPPVHTTLKTSNDALDSKNSIHQRGTKEVSFLHKIMELNIISSSLTVIHLKKNKIRYCKTRRQIMTQFLLSNSPILFLTFSHRSETRNDNKNNIFVPRRYLSKQRLVQDRLKFDSITDGIMGLVCGLIIMKKHVFVSFLIQRVWNGIHGRLLRDNIGWLETFPAGFKLNVPLTKVMGRATLWLTESHENFLRSVFMVTDDYDNNMSGLFIQFLGLVCIIFGFKLSCAIIFDLARLITLHINIMAGVFQNIYQMQLSLFSSLWHLFRGKKKNVLRKRSDTLEFDFMQLLLGMILFTICLFIFTTIFVYYMFFTCVQLTVVFYVMNLWGLYLILDKLPVGDIIAAAVSPGRFRKEVHFVSIPSNQLNLNISAKSAIMEEEDSGEGTDNVYQMIPSNLSPATIVGQVLGRCATQFLKNVPLFISEMLSGESSSVITTGLQMI